MTLNSKFWYLVSPTYVHSPTSVTTETFRNRRVFVLHLIFFFLWNSFLSKVITKNFRNQVLFLLRWYKKFYFLLERMVSKKFFFVELILIKSNFSQLLKWRTNSTICSTQVQFFFRNRWNHSFFSFLNSLLFCKISRNFGNDV